MKVSTGILVAAVVLLALLAVSHAQDDDSDSGVPVDELQSSFSMVNAANGFTVLTVPEDDDFSFLEYRYYFQDDARENRWSFYLRMLSQIRFKSAQPAAFEQVEFEAENAEGDNEDFDAEVTQLSMVSPWNCSAPVDNGVTLNSTCSSTINATAVTGITFDRIYVSQAIPKNTADVSLATVTVRVDNLLYYEQNFPEDSEDEEEAEEAMLRVVFRLSQVTKDSNLNRANNDYLRIFSGDKGELRGNTTFVDGRGVNRPDGDFTELVDSGEELEGYVFMRSQSQDINMYFKARNSNETNSGTEGTIVLFEFQAGLDSAGALYASATLLLALVALCFALL